MYNKENVVTIYGQEVIDFHNSNLNNRNPLLNSKYKYSDLLLRAYPEVYAEGAKEVKKRVDERDKQQEREDEIEREDTERREQNERHKTEVEEANNRQNMIDEEGQAKCDSCHKIGEKKYMGINRLWNKTNTVHLESYTCTDCDEAEKTTDIERYAELDKCITKPTRV